MNRQGPSGTILIAVVTIVVLIIINAIGLMKPVEAVVGLALKPVNGLFSLGSNDSSENEELRNKVAQLEAEVAKREEAARLNDALRSQLNFSQQSGFKLTGANIISQDPTNYKQYLTIDRGSSSGIQKGQVVVSQGLLVGKITETTTNTAKVYLITDFNSAVPVVDQETRATGLIRGDRGFGLKLEMVPQTDALKQGDTVISSGFGGEYPKGLVIGKVGTVNQRAADVFQSATIDPAVDFRKLEEVFVITGSS
jgi:rod shape-determining protein MreC